MTDETPDAGKRGQGMVLRGMVVKYCICGHPIGVETTSDPYRFYDSGNWNRQVEACPCCQRLIEAAGLDFSEKQKARLGRAYRLIRSWAREASQPRE